MKKTIALSLAAAALSAVSAPTLPVGDVRVGFAIGLGEWKPSKDAETSGGLGSPRALAAAGSVTHREMKSLSVTTNGNVVTAVWKGHPVCGKKFTVSAGLTLLPGGGFEYSSFRWDGNTSAKQPTRVVFPEVVVPRTAKTALFRPRYAGDILRPDWKKFKKGQKVYSSGLIFKVFNCMAAIEEGGVSHFLDQRGDARLHAAAFEVAAGRAPATIEMRNIWLPPASDAARKSCSLPYTGVFAPYRGGWYEAAKMHRDWIETQPWFKSAAARDFSRFRDIALWMWGRGGVETSEPPVHWFMKETGLKVALDWYWWHNVPYDTSYPFFWPPRDGEDAFRAAVKRMRDAGAFVQVYTNGMLWDEDDPRWAEGGLESVLVKQTGKIWSHTFNPFTKQSQAHSCGEAPKFHAKMRALEKTLASTGLDGVYIDMISCAAHLPCFNPRHSHAPGDAHAVIDGYRRYVGDIRSDNPGFLLSSEATSETYLDKFDAFIMLYSSWERNNMGVMPQVEPVPAVTVIYRGAGVIFGSFATPGGAPAWDPKWGEKPDRDEDVEAVVAKYPDQFAVEFARGIVWGVQPMVHNFTMKDVANPRIAKDVQFMKDSAKFYMDNRDLLFDGEMLAPAKIECDRKRVEFLSASCYRRVSDSKTRVQNALPCVFHSEWRAKDGREAAILVNWTREPRKYSLECGDVAVSGELPPLSWKRVYLRRGPVVVLPDAPTPVEMSAAEELAGELGKCLGFRPQIVRESSAGGCGTRLYVGATEKAKSVRGPAAYATDEVLVKSVPDGVVMDGDPARAPIYAADLYLEKFCGVRWWTSDASSHPRLAAPPTKGIDLRHAPRFKYRETYYLDGFDPLFKVRSKGNFSSLTRFMFTDMKFIPPEMGGNHRLYFYKGRHSAYHSFFEVLPPSVHFAAHPEWYSLVGGRREPKQLCLANAEMKEAYIKETLRLLREDPSVDFIQVSQNDWRGSCECDGCKAMAEEDGGAVSGPYLRFANEVAEAVEKEFPRVRIDTFAYQFTRKAPTKTRPRHNVVVRLCDIECDFARPLASPLPPRKAEFAKDLADWSRVAAGNLFIWDYLADFRSYMMPHPNIGSIAPNIHLFAENGAVGVFEQGDALCRAGSFATLRHYLVSHLLWDPQDDERRLVGEFLEGYYGKSAAPLLRKFIDTVEAGPAKTKQIVRCYHSGAPFLTGEDKLEAARLMDEAVAAAECDGPAFAARVRRERLSVDHMLLLNYDVLKRLAAKRGFKWTRPAKRREAAENWVRDVRAAGVLAVRETVDPDNINHYFRRIVRDDFEQSEAKKKPKPCRDVKFSPLPQGTMLYGDTSRLGPDRPFAKDPTVIRHGGRYLMYYSACAYSPERLPAGTPKSQIGWHGAIATSTNLVDWTRIGDIAVEGAPESVGWVAPCVKKFDGKIHLFAQGYDVRGIDAPKAKDPGHMNVLWHATSDDGIHFKSASDKPAFIAKNSWSLNRAIDAEAYRVGDRMMLLFATRDHPAAKIQQLGSAWAPYGCDYDGGSWIELSVDGPLLKPEREWEMNCLEAPTVVKRKGIWYMFYAGAYNHERQQIGLAWSADGANFRRWSDSPVLPHGAEGTWNAWESGHPGVFEDDDGQLYLFYQGKATLKGDYLLSCVKVEFVD